MNAYIFLAIGLILVYLEFFMPGAVLGTIGGIFILSSYFSLINSGSGPIELILFFVGSLVLLTLVIKFALYRIEKNKGGSGIYLSGDQEGYVASTFDKHAIGKEGIVLTDLKPGGFIVVDGKSQPALSLSGYIEKGQTVQIVSGDGESLIVKRKESL